MATIKPRRGTGTPSGLAQNELAIDPTNKRVYLGNAGGTGDIVASHISDYVTSLNGSTGAVVNVARTNEGNTFSVQQILTAGLSASASDTTLQITATSNNGIGIVVARDTNSANSGSRVGRIQLGRASTNIYNTVLENSSGKFTIYNGTTAGTALFSIDFTNGATAICPYFRLFSSVAVPETPVSVALRFIVDDGYGTYYNNDLLGNITTIGNYTNYLPASNGTLLNTTSSYVSGICGATGAITLSAGTGITISRSSGTFTITNIGVSSVNGSTGTVGISAGSNVTITQTGNTYTIASGGLSWSAVTADRSLVAEEGVLANKSSGTLTLTLPTTAALGKVIRVSGMQNTWRIAQNASQKIHFGKTDTTTGTSGYLENSNARDAVELVCCVADLEWNVISSIGNIVIV